MPDDGHLTAQDIIRGLSKGRWRGAEGEARCPAHDDRNPSLHVTERNGRVLFHCWAGCSQDEVLAALRRLGLWPEARDEHDESPRPKPSPRPVEPEPDIDPTGYARKIWARAIPIAGTLAEKYLREYRKIAGPLPETLRFSHSVKHREVGRYLPALIVPVFDAAGELRRVQAVFLDRQTGAKAQVPNPKRHAKKTYGRGASAIPAIFPGRKPGRRFDVILTEGPEDSLALWSVLQDEGGDVAATLGDKMLHKPEFAPGTRLLIVADNDAPGARAAQTAAAAHAIRGCEAWITSPPGEIKDSNDLLRATGAAGILAMLEAAEPFVAKVEVAATGIAAREAAERSRAAIERSFREALAWKADPEMPADPLDYNEPVPPVHGVRASLGIGKTEAVLAQLADPVLADHRINVYVPAHKLGRELLERYEALAGPGAPRARVHYGRGQIRPDGVAMCEKAETTKALAATGRSPQRYLCAGNKTESFGERCPFFDGCPYQEQRKDKTSGIRIMSHAHAFVDHPRCDIAVFDESFWRASLRGVEGRGSYLALWRLREVRDVPPYKRRELDYDATADLAAISARCAKAIEAGGTLADYTAAGVTEADARHAMVLEIRRIEPLDVTPGMPEATQRRRIEAYQTQEAAKFARYFRLLATCIAAGVDPICIDYRTVKNGDGAPEPRIYMHWRAPMKIGDVPC